MIPDFTPVIVIAVAGMVSMAAWVVYGIYCLGCFIF